MSKILWPSSKLKKIKLIYRRPSGLSTSTPITNVSNSYFSKKSPQFYLNSRLPLLCDKFGWKLWVGTLKGIEAQGVGEKRWEKVQCISRVRVVSKWAGCLQKDDVGPPKGAALILDTTKSNTSLQLQNNFIFSSSKMIKFLALKSFVAQAVIFKGFFTC